jgi:hypothetical protein
VHVSERHAVALDANLSRSRDKQVGLRWPAAVDDKLDRLLESAFDVGERTNRKELLAALVATTGFSGAELGSMLRTYRRMSVRDVLDQLPAETTVVQLTAHKPGPRARPGY